MRILAMLQGFTSWNPSLILKWSRFKASAFCNTIQLIRQIDAFDLIHYAQKILVIAVCVNLWGAGVKKSFDSFVRCGT